MPIYAITVFLSAFLLFQVEPMLAKYILPWFGGSASVWTTCLLFFQLLLLAGYAYAHFIGSKLTTRAQVILQLGLVALCVVSMTLLATAWKSPILPGPSWKPLSTDLPALQILSLVAVRVGLPYFVLATPTPLIQAWFARTHQASPYRLYALSNLGSLLALLTYPIVVEPRLRLRTQSHIWYGLFLLFAVTIGLSARILWKLGARDNLAPSVREDGDEGGATGIGTYTLWILLAACASLMLLASTAQMSQDIAPIPFLWILPLALYLISFIICFDSEQWYRRGIFHPALAIAVFLSFPVIAWGNVSVAFISRTGISPQHLTLIVELTISALLLFTICMVCHGELVRMRPHRRNLTAFYLAVAIGGALGGFVAAVVAPLLFPGYWEFRLAISIATLLVFIVLIRDRTSWIHQPQPVLAVILLAATLALPELMDVVARSIAYNLFALGIIAAMVALSAFPPKSGLLSWPGIPAQLSMLIAILVVGGLAAGITVAGYQSSILVTRNFYGVYRVVPHSGDDQQWNAFQLWSGRIMHGEQFIASDKRYQPTAYYGPGSGIGLLMVNHPNRSAYRHEDWAVRVGVVGLGTGTIAAWGKLGDYIRYYEINPAVIEIATDPDGFFSFVSDSSAKVEIIPGDARLSMERELATAHPQNFDVLAIDAFAGDAIPLHLLTREAMETYLRETAPDGVIALHVSNRFLNLAPLARELARAFNLRGGMVKDRPPPGGLYEDSDWILLSRTDKVLSAPDIASRLEPIAAQREVQLWTDDYTNLFQLLR